LFSILHILNEFGTANWEQNEAFFVIIFVKGFYILYLISAYRYWSILELV